MEPLFIDFEASSLSFESYPIEIAWGGAVGGIESFLISPEDVLGWSDWSLHSQRIHGLKKKDLLVNGLSPVDVITKVGEKLEGRDVYSDNPDFDGMWFNKLYLGAGIKPPMINLLHIDSLLIETVCPFASNRLEGLQEILHLKVSARNKVAIHHRAYYDVMYLIELWKLALSFRERGRAQSSH